MPPMIPLFSATHRILEALKSPGIVRPGFYSGATQYISTLQILTSLIDDKVFPSYAISKFIENLKNHRKI